MKKCGKQLLKGCALSKGMILLLFLSFPFLGYLPHPTLILAGIVGLTIAAWILENRKGKCGIHFCLLDSLVLLLALAFLLSGILTRDHDALCEGLTRALLLLFYFPARSFFDQSVWSERGAFALQLSGGIAAFLGIFRYFRGEALLKWVDPERFSDIGGRVTGGFGNPNVFSVYLLLIFPISLVILFRDGEPFLSRLFSFLCLCAELLCLILTWCRGAWLGAMLVLLLFFLFFSRRSRICIAVGMLPLVASCFFLPHNIVNRFGSIGDLNESSVRYRLFVWKGCLRMILDHPWGIGLGYESFTKHYLPYAVKGTETVIHSHQIFLQILCELGGIGLLLFLFFLGVLGFQMLKNRSGFGRDTRLSFYGGGFALIGALTAGLFDHVWYHHGVFCTFWIMAALSTVCLEQKRSKKSL